MPHDIKGLKKIKVSKEREGFDMPVMSEEMDIPPFPPSFRTNENQIPEIKQWETGEKYYMVIEIRQTEKTDREGQPVRAEFDIVRYKALSGKLIEDMTDKEFEDEEAKGLAS